MHELFHGAVAVCVYFSIATCISLVCRKLIRIPDELFRKVLHFVLLFSYIPFVFAFDTWWASVLFTIGLEGMFYISLALFERLPAFSSFLNERKKGELKRSGLLAFAMLAVCVSVCWGLLNDRYLVLACMYAWGVGDAFAALVGKAFGKHKIHMKYVDGRKSVEGSVAMLLTSAAAVLIILLIRGGLSPVAYVLIPGVGAAAATVVELITPDGMDTITCPIAAMMAILPMMALLGGFA